METNYHLLGSTENSKLVKIMQIVFGLVCIAVALFWLSYNLKSLASDGTLWITIIFLIGFGTYQILAGAGRATRFILINPDLLILKKNSVLPASRMKAQEIDRIEFYPLNVIFYLKSGKKKLLRFGTLYPETNEKIFNELIFFAESNNIPFKEIEEKL